MIDLTACRGQFTILLILQLSEPLTSQVIHPFAPQVRDISNIFHSSEPISSQLIRDLGVTHGDETKVGYYVGILVGRRCSSFELPLSELVCSNLCSSPPKHLQSFTGLVLPTI
jgi:hypothetical protein